MVVDILTNIMFFFIAAIAIGGIIGIASGYPSFGMFGAFLVLVHIGVETQDTFFTPIMYVVIVSLAIIVGARAYNQVLGSEGSA